MSIASLKDIPDLIDDLVAGRKRAIAFGLPLEAKRRFLMPIKYVLQPDENWEFAHTAVKPLSILLREDPANTVIIACAFPVENVQKKIAPYGDFPIINYFMLEYLDGFLPALRNLPVDYRRLSKRSTGKRGIVIRGAVTGDDSLLAIKQLASDHPNDYIVVSTWNKTDDPIKEQLGLICDRLVLNDEAPFPGYGNRNVQLACIQPGIKALLEAGVEKILVARSDHFFADPFMLDSFDAMLDAYPSPAAQTYGQKARLVVPDLFCRRYCPYHPSDMLTYGWAEDVARFWLPIQYDERVYPKLIHRIEGEENISYMSRNYPLTETFFGTAFLKHIGRPMQWTVEDSLSYYRDFFIVVSSVAFGMFWFKRTWFNRIHSVGKNAQFVTNQLWLALASGCPPENFVDIDINKVTWDDYDNDV